MCTTRPEPKDWGELALKSQVRRAQYYALRPVGAKASAPLNEEVHNDVQGPIESGDSKGGQ